MTDKILTKGDPNQPTIIIQRSSGKLFLVVLLIFLGFSMLLNLGWLVLVAELAVDADGPEEKFHSGDEYAEDKIARIEVGFTIMPPFTTRFLKTVEAVAEDDAVKGVLLIIDSPGGLVSDSHEIYHKLQHLSEKKPIYVQMKGIAASGGYYIAMGAGPDSPIYAEPTTWTGSIGVIIPRYDATELAAKVGVTADSMATGPLKDTMNPLKKLTDREREVWSEILDESFVQFLTVIDNGRKNLNMDQIRELATGQVYTANQALKNGLVDKISFEDETIKEFAIQLGLSEYQVVQYSYPLTLTETILGASTKTSAAKIDPVSKLLESGSPRAMYLFGWPYGLQTGSVD